MASLVRTKLGERFFKNLLGSSVENSVFEQPSEDLAVGIEEEISYLLENFESRISNSRVKVTHPPDTNDLLVHISYEIVGLPLPTQNIEFILQSTRI